MGKGKQAVRFVYSADDSQRRNNNIFLYNFLYAVTLGVFQIFAIQRFTEAEPYNLSGKLLHI